MTDGLPAALIGVRKPAGMTSHDVVARVRRALGLKRVGHAGTLDPGATGVLILGLGQATRLLGLVTLAEKSYVAQIALGAGTTTDDAEGEVVERAPVPAACLDPAFAQGRVAALVGRHSQVPPAISAVKKQGQRAWRSARRGEALELDPREVEVLEAALLGVEAAPDGAEGADDARGPEPGAGEVRWTVALRVSKGFYVRSLARDLGRDLGCFGHVANLERTRSGPVGLAACITLGELFDGGADAIRAHALDPLALAGLTERPLTAAELRRALAGRPMRALPGDGERVGIVRDGRLWGVWERRGPQLTCRANLPDGVLLGPAAASGPKGV